MRDKYKDISHRGDRFLKSLDDKEREELEPFVKNFELSCILSSFQESLLVIPFDVDKHHVELQSIHNYIRQLIISKLGEKMLYDAVYKTDKSSKESAEVLIKRMTKDPTENGKSGGFKLPPNINIHFVGTKK